MSRSEVHPHDVLLNITGASIGRCCAVPTGLGSVNVNQHVCAIRLPCPSKFDAAFLSAALASHIGQAQIEQLNAGSNREGLNYQQIRRFTVPWPDAPTRKAIAEVLDTMDEEIRKTEQLIAKLKQVKRGLLHDLLTRGIDHNGELRDPERHPEQFKNSPLGRLPRSWEADALGAAAEIIDPNPSHRYPNAATRGVPIASTENFVGDDDFDLTFSTCVPDSVFVAQDRRCHFHAQDVVFARKGRLGFARPYGVERKVFSHTVVLMKPRAGRSTHRYLLWSVRADAFFEGIRVRMNTNVGVPTLGVGFLASVPIAIPAPAEQEQLAAILDSADDRILAEHVELEKLRRLKLGLVEDLLSGCVRVTNLLTEAAA
jgi:type I restriction enzyme S subunit